MPSLPFVFCSFLRFLLQRGSTEPCTCVLGQLALNLSFLFVFLFVCLQKHCFPPEKGLFLFIFQCLSFFLLGFLHFSFSFPVSLSFSCLFFLSFRVLLFLFVTFLVFLLFFLALFLCFCFMTTTTTTSKY